MRECVKLSNWPDVCIDGEWKKAFYNTFNGKYYSYRTRAYRVWDSFTYRCVKGGYTQEKHPTYKGCINLFRDFQEFAEWVQSEQGYWNREVSGKFWSFDKDVIKPFNKVYSKDTCCFVPVEVNCLLLYSSKTRGEYPLGVYKHKKEVNLSAGCNNGEGKIIKLGGFTDPIEAHRAWQKFKVGVFRAKSVKFKNYRKISDGLELHAQLIEDDYLNQRETIR